MPKLVLQRDAHICCENRHPNAYIHVNTIIGVPILYDCMRIFGDVLQVCSLDNGCSNVSALTGEDYNCMLSITVRSLTALPNSSSVWVRAFSGFLRVTVRFDSTSLLAL